MRNDEVQVNDTRFAYRLKKTAKLVEKYTDNDFVYDIGYSLFPNPYLQDAIGIDIVKAPKKPSNYKHEIVADVCDRLPFKDGSIKCIVLSGVIENLEHPLKALREINRVLRPGGVLIMETPNPYFFPVIVSDLLMNTRFWFRDTHVNLFPRRIMLKLLWYSGFELKEIKSCGINLREHITLPCPQQFAQDIIYVAVKQKPDHKDAQKIIKLRGEGYT